MGLIGGAVAGGVLRLVVEWLVSAPLAASLVSVPAAWVLGMSVPAVLWFVQSHKAQDARALTFSVGLAEGAAGLAILLVGTGVLHAGLGWAGSAIHPVLGAHRAVSLSILAGAWGAKGFRGVQSPTAHES